MIHCCPFFDLNSYPKLYHLPQRRKWVSFHGLSINVEPDLSHFTGIVPCGITAHGVTSLVDLGLPVTMDDVDVALKQTFEASFPSNA